MKPAPMSLDASRAPWRHAWWLVALVCLLAACGGGGGGDGAEDAAAVAEPLGAAPGRATVQQTDRALDLAIFGDGMFPFIDAQGRMVYSRTARLGLDLQNRLVSTDGAWLAGVPDGKTWPGQPQALAAVPMTLPARATSTLRIEVNLEACAPVPAKAEAAALKPITAPLQGLIGVGGLLWPVNPGRLCLSDVKPVADSGHFGADFAVSAAIFDAGGRQRSLTLYFYDEGNAAWKVYAEVDAEQVWATDANGQPMGVLRFDPATGTLDPATARWTVAVPAHAEEAAGTWELVEIDLSGSTQFTGSSSLTALVQDGYPAGELQQIVVDGDDLIRLRYLNGQQRTHGRMLLAQFSVADRMRAVGQNGWLCEQQCAGPRFAVPTTQLTGQVRSGYLEPTVR